MSASWEGLLLIDKPAGPTSHDIVNTVRRATGERRIGHAGTLDPAATGLLPLVLGRATRLVRFLPHSPKTYRGTLRLGLTTATDDLEGQVLTRHAGPWPDEARVLAAARSLEGNHWQRPPRVSARKLGGERLYRLARRGVEADPPASEIEVFRFSLVPTADPVCFAFEAVVSGGTYIRALARDLGQALGCGGALASLRRTAIGPLVVEQAVALVPEVVPPADELTRRLIPIEEMPLDCPTLELADSGAADGFLNGRSLCIARPQAAGPHRVLSAEGRLLGVGDLTDGTLRPRVVLAPRLPGR